MSESESEFRDFADLGDSESIIPPSLRVAAILLGLQSVGLLVAAGVLVVKTISGHPDSVGRSLFGATMAGLGVLALLGCARGFLRLRATARTPALVLELLALPVSYSLVFQSNEIAYGGPILLSALAIIYLVFTPPARHVFDRRD